MVKLIRYYLNNGNTPDYVITEKDGQTCSGLWQNADMSLIGLGDVTGSEPGVSIFNTKDELVSYIETYFPGAKTPVFNYDNATTTWVPLDIQSAANDLWNLL
jgi:hypothetical protein